MSRNTFELVVELTDARTNLPIYVKPSKVSAVRAVENGKNTRVYFWNGYTILAKGGILTVAGKIFNAKYYKADREVPVTSLPLMEKTCFEW